MTEIKTKQNNTLKMPTLLLKQMTEIKKKNNALKMQL